MRSSPNNVSNANSTLENLIKSVTDLSRKIDVNCSFYILHPDCIALEALKLACVFTPNEKWKKLGRHTLCQISQGCQLHTSWYITAHIGTMGACGSIERPHTILKVR